MVRSICKATTLAAAALLAVSLADLAQAQPKTRADCERDFKPSVGQQGKDVVWVPTPDELVNRMLTMARVSSRDFVIDLGAGDGKIAIAAAKPPFGATALGIEYNPDMVRLANCMLQVEGVSQRVRIVQGDIFKEDFSRADVLTMYLLPDLNLCVRHRVLEMRPGTRVTSHQFTMGDWKADEAAEVEFRNAYLWIVPARVAGTWALRDSAGLQFSLSLTQTFQEIAGEVSQGGRTQPLVGATLRGAEMRFAFNDEHGVTRSFTGTVAGNQISGSLRGGGRDTQVSGSLQGSQRAAPWAEMPDQCKRFYNR